MSDDISTMSGTDGFAIFLLICGVTVNLGTCLLLATTKMAATSRLRVWFITAQVLTLIFHIYNQFLYDVVIPGFTTSVCLSKPSCGASLVLTY
jgi:hypothetical protein